MSLVVFSSNGSCVPFPLHTGTALTVSSSFSEIETPFLWPRDDFSGKWAIGMIIIITAAAPAAAAADAVLLIQSVPALSQKT